MPSLGYQKLLSTGNTKLKLKIYVNSFVVRAEEKIKAAGGEIITKKVVEKKKEKVLEEKSVPEESAEE